jgi:hypothetical protein
MCSIHFPQQPQLGLLYTVTVGKGADAQASGAIIERTAAIRREVFICGSFE